MALLEAIALLVGIIALFDAVPFLLQACVYYLYRPFIAIQNNGTVSNWSNRELRFEVEYIGPISADLDDSRMRTSIETVSLAGDGTIRYRSPLEFELPPGGSGGPQSPFQSVIDDRIEVRVYPRIYAEQFLLPTFLGYIDLKPVSRKIPYDNEGAPEEPNEEYFQREFPPPEESLGNRGRYTLREIIQSWF